LFTNFSF